MRLSTWLPPCDRTPAPKCGLSGNSAPAFFCFRGVTLRRSMCTVNHRTDIIPWYLNKGYVKLSEKPFPEPDRLTRASHMIYYEKLLL